MEINHRIEDYSPANIKGNPVRAWLDRDKSDKSEFQVIDDDDHIKKMIQKKLPKEEKKAKPITDYRTKKYLLNAILDIEKSYVWLRPTKKFYLKNELKIPIDVYRTRLVTLLLKCPYRDMNDLARAFESKNEQLIADIIQATSKKHF